MATNNLLVNNEKKVLYDIQKRVERSGHNLSQSRKFPCKVGYIYPFFCRKTLPSDSFKISTNILIKQLQPLLVPQIVSFTVNTAFYWVDYQLAFPQFEYFLINQRGQQNIELPYISDDVDSPYLHPISNDNLHVNVRTYLDFSKNEIREKVDALPFWAYQTIYRDFYLNIDRLSAEQYECWFPSNPNDWKLVPGLNRYFGDKTDASKAIDHNYLRVHNVRGDYFVNSYPTPLRGDVPTLEYDTTISGLTADLSGILDNSLISDTLSLDLNGKELYFNGQFGPNSPSPVQGITTNISYGSDESVGPGHKYGYSDSVISKVNAYPQYYTGEGNHNAWAHIQSTLNSLIESSRLGNYRGNVSLTNVSGLSQSLSITSRQLRLLESLTRKREIDILMKPRLKNYLQTYFDVKNYQNDSLYQPVFIGSTTQQILINDINQTTATSDSPLGRQGATAMSLGSGYVGEYFCRNYGCLMGLMYILPDYDYEPALPREWSERTPDDFYNPEFAHLSMQGILNKELYNSDDDSWNNEVLGYGGIYDNYRTSQNFVAGDLLNTSMQDVQQFAQVRRFSNNNKPEITTTFLDSAQAFDGSVFSVPSLPPFIAQCVTRVEAVRPIPEIATPRDS